MNFDETTCSKGQSPIKYRKQWLYSYIRSLAFECFNIALVSMRIVGTQCPASCPSLILESDDWAA